MIDAADRMIINALAGGFPVCERPFAVAGAGLGLAEDELIARIDRLLADGTLTRFGPLFDAEKMGGAFTLAAMQIPEQDFARAIRPNRYANLRGAFRYAVFVDREVWEHFGSEERIRETLRLLVDIAKRRPA